MKKLLTISCAAATLAAAPLSAAPVDTDTLLYLSGGISGDAPTNDFPPREMRPAL